MTARRGSARAAQQPANPRRIHELYALLVHDVGKYLARTARNLPAGAAVDAGLVAMLCRDLYGEPAGIRPALRFAELAAELLPLVPSAPLTQIADQFNELAGIEVEVRAGGPAAVARAVALALQIEAQLRTLASARPRLPNSRAR